MFKKVGFNNDREFNNGREVGEGGGMMRVLEPMNNITNFVIVSLILSW